MKGNEYFGLWYIFCLYDRCIENLINRWLNKKNYLLYSTLDWTFVFNFHISINSNISWKINTLLNQTDILVVVINALYGLSLVTHNQLLVCKSIRVFILLENILIRFKNINFFEVISACHFFLFHFPENVYYIYFIFVYFVYSRMIVWIL